MQRCRALLELAVFAAASVEADVRGTAIARRLTGNAGPNTRERPATSVGDSLPALDAVNRCLASRHARPGSHDAVRDSVVDLLLHRPVRGPTTRHRLDSSVSGSEHVTSERATPFPRPAPAHVAGVGTAERDCWPASRGSLAGRIRRG